MKIAIILGTRPEIIKLSSIIRYCERNNLDYFIIHTNQHYSENMDKVFFNILGLPTPKYNLNLNKDLQTNQKTVAIKSIQNVLLKEKPDIVVVQGDTNTVLAGALAAARLKIKVAHVEAGLRSYDKSMPEELNRITVDHISDYCFAPTEIQKKILLKEGIEKSRIFVVGNTITDAVLDNLKLSKKTSILKKLNLKKNDYFLVTAHRPSNVDNKKELLNLCKTIDAVSKEFNVKIVYPIHPRSIKMLSTFNINFKENIILTESLGFLDFLELEKNARLILTDSGGVQEEACILKVPCITLRKNTERPETVDVGANIVAGLNPKNVLSAVEMMLKKEKNWQNPFGNGKTGEKIMEIILR